MVPEFFSIPSKHVRPLLDKLKADIRSWNGSNWSGDSETLKEYFKQNRIDPKIDPRYKHYFDRKRHDVAGSYTWRFTNLYEFADKADEPSNADKLLWIDVLVVPQFSISSSDQVIITTDTIYYDCEVWVFLDHSYLSRAWCLAESAQYSKLSSKCVLVVSGEIQAQQS
jgi:hypothetical protein